MHDYIYKKEAFYNKQKTFFLKSFELRWQGFILLCRVHTAIFDRCYLNVNANPNSHIYLCKCEMNRLLHISTSQTPTQSNHYHNPNFVPLRYWTYNLINRGCQTSLGNSTVTTSWVVWRVRNRSTIWHTPRSNNPHGVTRGSPLDTEGNADPRHTFFPAPRSKTPNECTTYSCKIVIFQLASNKNGEVCVRSCL